MGESQVPFWCSSRLGLTIIVFVGCLLLYAVRINLSVAMVCMVNHTAIARPDANTQVALTNLSNYNISSSDPAYSVVNLTSDDANVELCSVVTAGNNTLLEDGSFVWDKPQQGLLLGAFFYGYMASQFPGGWIAKKLGGKRVMGASMFITAVCTILTPVAARISFYFVLVLRIILGVCGGVVFPALHTMWAVWAPPLESTKLVGFSYAGIYIGNVITLASGGFLCKYGFDGGWPSIFYLLGALTFIWTVLWMFLTSETPADHRRITEVERNYIEKSLKKKEGVSEDEDTQTVEPPIPWCAMLRSPAVWAIIVSNTGCDWGGYTFLTNIPTYMKEVLKFDIASNGLFSCLPYIGMWAVINISAVASDYCRKRGLSTAWSRKIFDGIIGKMVPALFLIGLGFMTCEQQTGAVVLLTLGVAISGCQFSGFVVNHVDIAPRYAGILIGISNSIGASTGFIAPYVIGVITKDQTQEQWQIVFFIAAAIYIATGIFYCIFASGEVQEWARDQTEQDNELLPAKHARNEKLARTDSGPV